MSEAKGGTRPAVGVGQGEVETSGTEKVLAVVLAIFIAIGAIWGYFKLDDLVKGDPVSYAPSQALIGPAQQQALRDQAQANRAQWEARNDLRAATRELELRREAYRTALDAGESPAELEAQYEAAQGEQSGAVRELAAANAAAARTRPAAREARSLLLEQRREQASQANADQAEDDRIVFLLRLALLVAMLAGAYWLLSRMRTRRSRYFPAALALVGATALLACVMAVDYADGYLAFDEVGPLAISIFGVALTLGAIVALQRFLAKRIPVRRVRRGECPFCGFPLRGPHCEGCGRAVVASCSSCHKDRRVGTPRCASCGSA